MTVHLQEDIISVSYLGTGMKIARLAKTTMQQVATIIGKNRDLYKHYSSMDDDELTRALPLALASDLNAEKQCGRLRPVIIVDNYDEKRAGQWFEQLIDKTRSIMWIIVTDYPLKLPGQKGQHIQVQPLNDKETESFLKEQCGIAVSETRKKIVSISGGSLFIIQRILDILDGRYELGEAEWESLQEKGLSQIMSHIFNNLPSERKEILIQLSFAKSFDEKLFKQLFPGKIFGIYENWFQGSMFMVDSKGTWSIK